MGKARCTSPWFQVWDTTSPSQALNAKATVVFGGPLILLSDPYLCKSPGISQPTQNSGFLSQHTFLVRLTFLHLEIGDRWVINIANTFACALAAAEWSGVTVLGHSFLLSSVAKLANRSNDTGIILRRDARSDEA